MMAGEPFFFPIQPVAKPRMTRRDKWATRDCVLRYRAFKDECRLRRVTLEWCDDVTFILPMPKSWSEKKKAKMDGQPHTGRPDIDNLWKALAAMPCTAMTVISM